MRQNVENMKECCQLASEDKLIEFKKETDKLSGFLKSLKETTKVC